MPKYRVFQLNYEVSRTSGDTLAVGWCLLVKGATASLRTVSFMSGRTGRKEPGRVKAVQRRIGVGRKRDVGEPRVAKHGGRWHLRDGGSITPMYRNFGGSF